MKEKVYIGATETSKYIWNNKVTLLPRLNREKKKATTIAETVDCLEEKLQIITFKN